MTDLYIDTEVIVDFIIDRQPFSKEAAQLFTLIEQKKVKGYTSALSFSNLYYVLSRYASHKKVITIINELSTLIGILKADDDIIKASLVSESKDFEDAIQFYTIRKYKRIDGIITRNMKDYKMSSLPIMTPETFLRTFEQTDVS
jgi:predicted nucleic acid-binding protein